MSHFSRRSLIRTAAKSSLALGFSPSNVGLAASRHDESDEHFFIFVELRGGVHWACATDGRDLEALPLADTNACHLLRLSDQPPTIAEFAALRGDEASYHIRGRENGPFIILPYIDDLQASYRKGRTSLGASYILGFAGFGLEPHVDDVAVVRGVRMLGTFHGSANNEIFSGSPSSDSFHVAGVLSHLLRERLGVRLLDNLVFENATYTARAGGNAQSPIRLDAKAFARLLAGNNAANPQTSAAMRFERARRLALAFASSPALGRAELRTLEAYARSLAIAPQVLNQLEGLRDRFSDRDASLDLDLQFDTAISLIRTGLSRVVTLCLGAPNDENKVDGFGLFDAHRGLYHINDTASGSVNTHRHHENVRKVITSISRLIQLLKSTTYDDRGTTLWDKTTVVVSSEFARPSNLYGNEAGGGSEQDTAFGNGHYNYNNNYILLGRGVRGGAWIGHNDPLRQMAHQVDMHTLASGDISAIRSMPVRVDYRESSQEWVPLDLNNAGSFRPFMAKDVLRTIMAIAGVESQFANAYPASTHADAQVLWPIVAGRL